MNKKIQSSGFVNRKDCELCSWPHHRRVVRKKWAFRKKNRKVVFIDECCNCRIQTVVHVLSVIQEDEQEPPPKGAIPIEKTWRG